MPNERLVSLRISNGALAGDKLPDRIKVLGWGRNESVYGPVLLDEQAVASLNANQRKLGHDRVALDYEHNTVPGSDEYARTKEPREVAAFGTVEPVAGDGLYLKDLTWTPGGQAHARNYEDLSLAPKLDEENRVVFVHSAALTRNGAVYDLSFFNANCPDKHPTKQTPMAEQIDGIVPQLAALTTSVNTLATRLDALEKRPDASAQLATLNTGFTELQKQIKAGLDAAQDAEKGKVIALFAADGKVPMGADAKPISDEDLRKLDLPTLRLLHANTAVTVPLSARGKVAAKQESELKGLERTAAAIKADLAARGLA